MTEINRAVGVVCGDFTVTGGIPDKDYTFLNGVLTIRSSAAVIIRNTDSAIATTHRIVVAGGVNANIILAGVNIDVSTADNKAAFQIEDNSDGNVNVTLFGNNSIKSGENCAGLQKNGTGGRLTISGDGHLSGTGGFAGAGIGGSRENDSSNILISGGDVTVAGGCGAAGIGGGIFGNAADILISGGTVMATGGMYGAGIGSGMYGTEMDIEPKENGCGGAADHIEISGGIVMAIGGLCAAGIGGGDDAEGSHILISGGMVTAVGGSSGGQSIGGGLDEKTGNDDGSVGGSNNSVGGMPFIPAETGTTAIMVAGTDGVLLIDGKNGTVTGNVALDNDITVPNGAALDIIGEADKKGALTVKEGVTFTNNGTVKIDTGGKLVVKGIFVNNGTLVNRGDVLNNGAML